MTLQIGTTMFKKPLNVELSADSIDVNHEIKLPILTFVRTQTLIIDAKKSVIAVIVIAAVAKTTSEIATHIAKTYIK